jgi:hypothetical protein
MQRPPEVALRRIGRYTSTWKTKAAWETSLQVPTRKIASRCLFLPRRTGLNHASISVGSPGEKGTTWQARYGKPEKSIFFNLLRISTASSLPTFSDRDHGRASRTGHFADRPRPRPPGLRFDKRYGHQVAWASESKTAPRRGRELSGKAQEARVAWGTSVAGFGGGQEPRAERIPAPNGCPGQYAAGCRALADCARPSAPWWRKRLLALRACLWPAKASGKGENRVLGSGAFVFSVVL